MALKLIPPGARKGNRHYLVRGTFRGRRVEVSSQTSRKAAAERFLADFLIQLGEGVAQRGHATFNQVAKLYVAYRRPSRNDERYLRLVCLAVGDMLVEEIRQSDIVKAAAELLPSASNETKNRQIFTPASAVLHYAAREGLCGWQRVEKLKEKRPEPRAVSQGQAGLLLAAATGYELLLLTVLFRHGLRISDALRIAWSDIDLAAGTVKVHVRKTDDWVTLGLHDDVLDLLAAIADREGRLFPWKDRGRVYRWLRPLAEKVGVRFTPHMARHSFATWHLNDGASLAEVMEAGVWRDHKSVLRYGKVQPERVRTVINRIGKRGNSGGNRRQVAGEK